MPSYLIRTPLETRQADTECELRVGDKVVVKTSRGLFLGDVSLILPEGVRLNRRCQIKSAPFQFVRVAKPHDISRAQSNAEIVEKAKEMFVCPETRVASMVVNLEKTCLFLVFYAGDPYDAREFAHAAGKRFGVKVMIQQCNARDSAAIVGGMGVCGRQMCCSSWMRKPPTVRSKGVKESPPGICDRPRCCGIFEDER